MGNFKVGKFRLLLAKLLSPGFEENPQKNEIELTINKHGRLAIDWESFRKSKVVREQIQGARLAVKRN